MFERYNDNARRTLLFARDEAGQSGSLSIDTLHLLLGLIREPAEMIARIFAEAGLSLPGVRHEIHQLADKGPPISTSVEIPFYYDSQNALRAAAEEADRLLHNHVGPEHLLLGLLRVEESAAARLLSEQGLGLAAARDAIVETHSSGSPERPGLPPLHTPQAVIAYAWDGDERFVDLPDDAPVGLPDIVSQRHSSTPEAIRARLRDGIETRFTVTRETRAVTVHVMTTAPGGPGPALRPCRQSNEGGVGFVSAAFSTLHDEPFHDRAPRFIDRFSAAGMPFEAICRSLEQILGRPLVDETGLSGIYDVDWTSNPQTVDAFLQSLREEAGLVITPATRDVPHLIVRRR